MGMGGFEDNVRGHAVFGLLDTTADCVIVDGKVILRDGRCPGIDEDEVVRECREAAEVLWKKMA